MLSFQIPINVGRMLAHENATSLNKTEDKHGRVWILNLDRSRFKFWLLLLTV